MRLLDGKVLLVTGRTSGIGRESAILFAREGAKVAFIGGRATKVRDIVEEIDANAGEAPFFKLNIRRFWC